MISTKTVKTTAIVALLAISAFTAHQPATSSASNVASMPHPVIYSLVSRHQTLIVTSTPTGPLYSVKDPTGRIILPPSTLQQVSQADPNLYRWINSAVAATASIDLD